MLETSKDLEILQNLKKGDEKAYKELFDLYYIPLCIYSLKYCYCYDVAEDIVQDLFIKFWNEKLYLKIDNTISPYLFKAVKNNSLQFQKSNPHTDEINDYLYKVIEGDEEEIDMESLEREKEKLYQEIEKLPEKSREIFKAIVLDNLRYKEVANQFDISVNTVKTQYSRALSKLRESLDIIVLLLIVS